MEESSSSDVTVVLRAIGRGQAQAAADLLPLVYAELRRLAVVRLARLPPGHTLQPTALVHEAYLRLVGPEDPGWDGRAHFFGAAARAMRQILVDHARRKLAAKRGGGRQPDLRLDQIAIDLPTPASDLIALDDALARLEARDERKGRVVILRYFAGLTHEEVARVLGVSLPTVERDWRFARAWLATELGDGEREEAE